MRVAAARDERGAVAVIVAICAVVLFGFGAYAIDAGNLWQTRRNMVTATDASALAAASDYAVGSDGCSSTAASTLAANRADAAVDTCASGTGSAPDSGHVTVRATTTVDYLFAGVLGLTDADIHSTTTAEWGLPSGARGLRPFGLCIDANQQFTSWLNLPAGPTGTSGVIRITYGKAQPLACGTAPGNWGVLDFNGGSNPQGETNEWAENGYPDLVSIGAQVPGNTGSFNTPLTSALDYLVASGEEFALPVFDAVANPGSNASFHIVAFVNVKLVGFRLQGNQASRYMDLVFSSGVLEGTCCGNGLDTGARVLRICDVDTLSPNTSDPRAC